MGAVAVAVHRAVGVSTTAQKAVSKVALTVLSLALPSASRLKAGLVAVLLVVVVMTVALIVAQGARTVHVLKGVVGLVMALHTTQTAVLPIAMSLTVVPALLSSAARAVTAVVGRCGARTVAVRVDLPDLVGQTKRLAAAVVASIGRRAVIVKTTLVRIATATIVQPMRQVPTAGLRLLRAHVAGIRAVKSDSPIAVI